MLCNPLCYPIRFKCGSQNPNLSVAPKTQISSNTHTQNIIHFHKVLALILLDSRLRKHLFKKATGCEFWENSYANSIMLKFVFFLHNVILCIKNNCNVCFYIEIYIKNINYKITLSDYSALKLEVICIKSQASEANSLGLHPANVFGS